MSGLRWPWRRGSGCGGESVNQKQLAFMEAEKRRLACAEWIAKFIQPGQQRTITKEDLYGLAKAELGISRSGFDQAWIMAIENADRQDWYNPARRTREQSH